MKTKHWSILIGLATVLVTALSSAALWYGNLSEEPAPSSSTTNSSQNVIGSGNVVIGPDNENVIVQGDGE